MPIYKLGKMIFCGYKKDIVTNIEFVSNTKIIRRNVIKSGRSRCPFISWLITKSKLPPKYERYRSVEESGGSQIHTVNEEIYIHGFY